MGRKQSIRSSDNSGDRIVRPKRQSKLTKIIPGATLGVLLGTAPGSTVSIASASLAMLQSVSGTVNVTKAGSHHKIPGFEGMHLDTGDEITTGENGTATIHFLNGTTSAIGTRSDITLAQVHQSQDGSWQTTVKVWAGNLWSRVSSLLNAGDKYDVQTPTAVMGVRGTMFDVHVGAGSPGTDLSVFDGAVGVDGNNGHLPAGGITSSGLQQTQQAVTAHNQLSTWSNTFMPPPNNLNVWDLVQYTDPDTLVAMVHDTVDSMGQDHTAAVQQQQHYLDSNSLDSLNSALVDANKAAILVREAQELLNTVQISYQSKAVGAILQSQGQSLSQSVQQLQASQTSIDETQQQIVNVALNHAGYTQQQIDQMAPPVYVPTGGDTPPPPPTVAPPPGGTQPPPGGTDTGSGSGTESPPGGTESPPGGAESPPGNTESPPGNTDPNSPS